MDNAQTYISAGIKNALNFQRENNELLTRGADAEDPIQTYMNLMARSLLLEITALRVGQEMGIQTPTILTTRKALWNALSNIATDIWGIAPEDAKALFETDIIPPDQRPNMAAEPSTHLPSLG